VVALLGTSASSTLLFGPLKQPLWGHKFHNNEELERVFCEWLQVQKSNVHCKGIFKLMPRWDGCIKVLRNYTEKYTSLEGISYI
jgi:hypothetical protein